MNVLAGIAIGIWIILLVGIWIILNVITGLEETEDRESIKDRVAALEETLKDRSVEQ